MIDSTISLFGHEIPIYGIFFYIGMIVAAAVAVLLRRRANIDLFDIAGSGVYIMIGAIAGAKLYFLQYQQNS